MLGVTGSKIRRMRIISAMSINVDCMMSYTAINTQIIQIATCTRIIWTGKCNYLWRKVTAMKMHSPKLMPRFVGAWIYIFDANPIVGVHFLSSGLLKLPYDERS